MEMLVTLSILSSIPSIILIVYFLLLLSAARRTAKNTELIIRQNNGILEYEKTIIKLLSEKEIEEDNK